MTVFFSRSSLKYLKKLEPKTAKKLVEACENLPGKGDVRKYFLFPQSGSDLLQSPQVFLGSKSHGSVQHSK
jgi:mRNA-degrading endonuclease RelE of RelBE toxin-antitoxin system